MTGIWFMARSRDILKSRGSIDSNECLITRAVDRVVQIGIGADFQAIWLLTAFAFSNSRFR